MDGGVFGEDFLVIINSSLILVNDRLFSGGMLCRVGVDRRTLRL